RAKASKVRTHARRSSTRTTTQVTVRERGGDDYGTSSSQAWAYGYQMGRGGLQAGEDASHHYGAGGRYEEEGAYGEREGYGYTGSAAHHEEDDRVYAGGSRDFDERSGRYEERRDYDDTDRDDGDDRDDRRDRDDHGGGYDRDYHTGGGLWAGGSQSSS